MGDRLMKLTVPMKILSLLATTALVLNSCGDEDDANDLVDGVTGVVGEASSVNGLALAFPHSLAASAFPTSTTTLALAEERGKTVREKIEDTDRVLRGEADECFQPGRFTPFERPEVTCYEFDNDMNPFNNGPAGEGGTVDGKHTDGEACMVAFAREQVGDAIDELERALEIVKAMICQARKAGADTEPPTEGQEKVYTEVLAEAVGASGPLTITEAKVSGVAPVDGRASFATGVSFTDPKGREVALSLTHTPGATTDEDQGVLTRISTALGPNDQPGPGNNNEENMRNVVSIKYSGTTVDGEPRMRFVIKRANILNTIEATTDDGDINYAEIPEGDGNSTSNNFNLTAFDINPETNAGQMSYWRNPGGSYNEAARGFIFDISQKEDGYLKGCGVSGAVLAGTNPGADGTSIRKFMTQDGLVLEPLKFWHPFLNAQGMDPGNTDADRDPRYNTEDAALSPGTDGVGDKVTKQCFTQNAEGTQYEIDTELTTDTRGYSLVNEADKGVNAPSLQK